MHTPSQLAGRPVLVTGASGFIGAHLVRRLTMMGAEVHAVVRGRHGAERVLANAAGDGRPPRVWTADVGDATALRRCVRGAAPVAIVHLAGDTSVRRRTSGDWDAVDRSVAVNLQGTLNVLRAAAESGAPVETLVRTGGIEEYGLGPVPYSETQREHPVSPYSASQVAATHYCQALQPSLAFAAVTLRPALVYGPGQGEGFLIPQLVRACLRGDEEFTLGAGGHSRDLLYIDDLVDALVRAIERGPMLRGAVINVGTGVEHRMADVAAQVVALSGAGLRLVHADAPPRAGDVEHLVTRTEVAAELLGWRAGTALGDGLARTVAAYSASAVAAAALPSFAQQS